MATTQSVGIFESNLFIYTEVIDKGYKTSKQYVPLPALLLAKSNRAKIFEMSYQP